MTCCSGWIRTAQGGAGIDLRGVIVGWYAENDLSTACLWQSGQVTKLPMPSVVGSEQSQALGINRGGEIVGVAGTGDLLFPYNDHAEVWISGEAFDLNDVLPKGSPYFLRRACAVNDRGQIACSGEGFNAYLCFLLTPNPDSKKE